MRSRFSDKNVNTKFAFPVAGAFANTGRKSNLRTIGRVWSMRDAGL